MTNLELVKVKVQALLSEALDLSPILEKGGAFRIAIPDSATTVFIELDTVGVDDQHVVVMATAPILREVVPSEELFKWVSNEGTNYVLGHVRTVESEDGTYILQYCNAILGDYLDEAELEVLIWSTFSPAEDLSGELQNRFGGKRWIDQE